jgi:uncharacterized protein (DUF924 family)
MANHRPDDVLAFWFGDGADYGKRHQRWFEKDAAFDAALRQRFATLHQAAAAGALDHWAVTPHGTLALLLLLDQLSRNLYRGSPQAFACDPHALAVATAALDRGFDRQVTPQQAHFFYLPFMHAEDLAAQQRCVELFAATDEAKYAVGHRDIIARFGRFPHRNAVLGRESTADEVKFLKGPNSSY